MLRSGSPFLCCHSTLPGRMVEYSCLKRSVCTMGGFVCLVVKGHARQKLDFSISLFFLASLNVKCCLDKLQPFKQLEAPHLAFNSPCLVRFNKSHSKVEAQPQWEPRSIQTNKKTT